MRRLVLVLASGFVVFNTLAIVQERDVFLAALRPAAAPAAVPDTGPAQQAVRLFLALSRHFYASGGDTRFSERMPAGGGAIAEMRADIEYLARNNRVQNPELVRLELVGAEPLPDGRVEVRTREWWTIHFLWADSGAESDPPAIRRVSFRYLVARGSLGWRVEGWEPVFEAEPGS